MGRAHRRSEYQRLLVVITGDDVQLIRAYAHQRQPIESHFLTATVELEAHSNTLEIMLATVNSFLWRQHYDTVILATFCEPGRASWIAEAIDGYARQHPDNLVVEYQIYLSNPSAYEEWPGPKAPNVFVQTNIIPRRRTIIHDSRTRTHSGLWRPLRTLVNLLGRQRTPPPDLDRDDRE